MVKQQPCQLTQQHNARHCDTPQQALGRVTGGSPCRAALTCWWPPCFSPGRQLHSNQPRPRGNDSLCVQAPRCNLEEVGAPARQQITSGNPRGCHNPWGGLGLVLSSPCSNPLSGKADVFWPAGVCIRGGQQGASDNFSCACILWTQLRPCATYGQASTAQFNRSDTLDELQDYASTRPATR